MIIQHRSSNISVFPQLHTQIIGIIQSNIEYKLLLCFTDRILPVLQRFCSMWCPKTFVIECYSFWCLFFALSASPHFRLFFRLCFISVLLYRELIVKYWHIHSLHTYVWYYVFCVTVCISICVCCQLSSISYLCLFSVDFHVLNLYRNWSDSSTSRKF